MNKDICTKNTENSAHHWHVLGRRKHPVRSQPTCLEKPLTKYLFSELSSGRKQWTITEKMRCCFCGAITYKKDSPIAPKDEKEIMSTPDWTGEFL